MRTNVWQEGGLAGWFDPDAAEVFEAQSSRWNRQLLYRTAGGRWVLRTWSAWLSTPDTYIFISDYRAEQWLIANHRDTDVERFFAPLTPESGPRQTAVEAGARALHDAFPTLHEDFTDEFFSKAALIVLRAAELQGGVTIVVAP